MAIRLLLRILILLIIGVIIVTAPIFGSLFF